MFLKRGKYHTSLMTQNGFRRMIPCRSTRQWIIVVFMVLAFTLNIIYSSKMQVSILRSTQTGPQNSINFHARVDKGRKVTNIDISNSFVDETHSKLGKSDHRVTSVKSNSEIGSRNDIDWPTDTNNDRYRVVRSELREKTLNDPGTNQSKIKSLKKYRSGKNKINTKKQRTSTNMILEENELDFNGASNSNNSRYVMEGEFGVILKPSGKEDWMVDDPKNKPMGGLLPDGVMNILSSRFKQLAKSPKKRSKLAMRGNANKGMFSKLLTHKIEPSKNSNEKRETPPKRTIDVKGLKEAEVDMRSRRKRVQETCTKHKLGKYKNENDVNPIARYPPSANYDVLYIDRKDGLTYCPVYKAASTSWLYTLSKLAGADLTSLNTTKQQISTLARNLWPQLDYDDAAKAVPDTFKFMIVRHPFERLVSAYRDKFENLNIGREHGIEYFYQSYGKKIVKKYRRENQTLERVHLDEDTHLPKPVGVEPTFREFVQYIIDTDLVVHSDDHWMPYYLFCTPCYIDYDAIVKFETIARDQKYVLKQLNLQNKVDAQWKHLTKGKKSASIVKKYLALLSAEEKRDLYKKYEIDFQMYGYV